MFSAHDLLVGVAAREFAQHFGFAPRERSGAGRGGGTRVRPAERCRHRGCAGGVEQILDRPLPPPYGFPLRLRIPTKLGFKNAKFIRALYVTDKDPGGYWEDQGYYRFAGL
jgi:hypothetical protein